MAAKSRSLSRLAFRQSSTYIAAIDQGTSSSRVILYDSETLTPVASHQETLASATSAPHPGWSQMNPTLLLKSVETCKEMALSQLQLHVSGVTSSSISGIGITNQRESVVVWDKHTGEALTDVILWHDTRTRETVHNLTESLGGPDALRSITGLPLSTYFSGVKLRWVMDNVPPARKAIEEGRALVGTVDSFLTWHLTGGERHVIDVTNASRTLMMDIHKGSWSDDAINALDLDMLRDNGCLPEIVSCASSDGFGVVKSGAMEGVRITGVIGDQQSAMVGQRCFEPGMAKTTYGTGAFALMNTEKVAFPSKAKLLTTALYSEPGPLKEHHITYALEGAVGSCANGINWFRDNLGMIDSPAEISELAHIADEKHGGTEGLYFVSAFGGLLAPYWRDDARGTLVGLTLAHDKSHIALAVLEGVAFQVRAVLDSMVADTDGAHSLAQMRVDGGVSMSRPLLQAQADLLGVTVARPKNVETTALGAAIVAGAGSGIWDRYEDSPRGLLNDGDDDDLDEIFLPKINEKEREEKWASWEQAVESSLGWAGRK
eukprot:CAMPEP_0195511574 /NCGR_PEP_ID=MMETSP0794_2-20130614/3845_1 /TAXON_ID=515487 /ORGANISM="Stephanopyxis turris, Strain CCMP 815" /LENGTH=545 /DNA_ID=CAMNT_0040639201 /DNA_START=218 /DNA_END=1855 /DNA_ORIENTATION=+